jgi:hypothetical protein
MGVTSTTTLERTSVRTLGQGFQAEDRGVWSLLLIFS